MDKYEQDKHDIIDEDLVEEFDDEEMYELVMQAQREAIERAELEKKNPDPKPKRPFPKWPFWLIAIALAFNIVAALPQTLSIPAINFLVKSATLSAEPDIKEYKKSVVVIETEDGRGTGFSISSEGTIITNHHVVEGESSVTVAFSEQGLFEAEVVDTYPDIDIAILEVDEENLPYLELASEAIMEHDATVNFIGNPLRFQGIANEGTMIDYILLSDWEDKVVMIDAPVYRGNSGSPIINEAGEVIGVIFATLDHDEYGRVGLFVPIDYYYRDHKRGE